MWVAARLVTPECGPSAAARTTRRSCGRESQRCQAGRVTQALAVPGPRGRRAPLEARRRQATPEAHTQAALALRTGPLFRPPARAREGRVMAGACCDG